MEFVTLTMVRSAERYNDEGEAVETLEPVLINPALVRSFNARRHEKPGTRITFANGRGFAVSESVADVNALLGGEPAEERLALTHQS